MLDWYKTYYKSRDKSLSWYKKRWGDYLKKVTGSRANRSQPVTSFIEESNKLTAFLILSRIQTIIKNGNVKKVVNLLQLMFLLLLNIGNRFCFDVVKSCYLLEVDKK